MVGKIKDHCLGVSCSDLTGECCGSLLSVTSSVFDKFLMIAFTYTSKEVNGAAKEDHIINKFGKGMHFWKFPSLSNLIIIVISSWETCLNELDHV